MGTEHKGTDRNKSRLTSSFNSYDVDACAI